MDGDQTALFVDDQVQLVTERGDVKQISLGKGNPAESREAFEALGRGMRPSKFKIRILSGDMEWTATLEASTLGLGGLHMPPTQNKDPQGRIMDRTFLLEEVAGHLDRRFGQFLALRTQDPEALETEIKNWIRAGLEGLPAGVEVPWES
jgi:hypothetical protein